MRRPSIGPATHCWRFSTSSSICRGSPGFYPANGEENNSKNAATLDQAATDMSPIPDEADLAELGDTVGPDVLRRLVTQGIVDRPDRLTRKLERREPSDFEQIQGHAHDVKSSAGGLGATRLYDIAMELDIPCQENRTEDALRLLDLPDGEIGERRYGWTGSLTVS